MWTKPNCEGNVNVALKSFWALALLTTAPHSAAVLSYYNFSVLNVEVIDLFFKFPATLKLLHNDGWLSYIKLQELVTGSRIDPILLSQTGLRTLEVGRQHHYLLVDAQVENPG